MNKSTYIQEYQRATISQQSKLKVIFDLYEGKGYKYFDDRYLGSNNASKGIIDWKRRYESSNYMSSMVDEFTEFIPLMRDLEGISSISKSTIEKKQVLFDKWLDKINWKFLEKNIGRLRKLGGNVYLHWYIEEDRDGFKYPNFKMLDARHMTINQDEEEKVFSYVWTDTVTYQERSPQSNALYTTKTKNIKWEFLRGVTYIYENEQLVDTIESKIDYKDDFQLINIEYMKEDDSPYSMIPCEGLIDGCIRLDKIETMISTTNMQSGSPQLIIADGVMSQSSGFGQNGILWLESNSEIENRKVQWGQLEITNGLESMLAEWDNVLNSIYKKANLTQPKLLEKLTTTDSSKVISSIRINTENEIRDLLLEIILKFKLPIEILFKENNMLSKKDNLQFKLPDILINMSAFDEYLLRTQQMALGIKTVQDNLREYTKYNNKQIDQKIKEHNEEVYDNKSDIEVNRLKDSPGLDNNFKGAIKQ